MQTTQRGQYIEARPQGGRRFAPVWREFPGVAGPRRAAWVGSGRQGGAVMVASISGETRLLLSSEEDGVGETRWVGRRVTKVFLRALLGSVVLGVVCAVAFSGGAINSGSNTARLGEASSTQTCIDGFADDLPTTPPVALFLLNAMPTLGESSLNTKSHYANCAAELTSLPVVTSNDAYRLGNSVERLGVGWLGARRLVLENKTGYQGSILFNYLMGESEQPRSFVACVVGHKKALEARGVPSAHLHGDDNTIVVPLRLSDKVRFMTEDYPVINTAVLEYQKKYCPLCVNLVLVTLLVWGEDKNHMFRYNDEEYGQSLAVLHSIARKAQTADGGNFKVTIRSTLNADDDFVYSGTALGFSQIQRPLFTAPL
jgi:hypothetical protein